MATLLHDLGLEKRSPAPLRFEVEGANAARRFAGRPKAWTRGVAQLIWDGVALNSTPSLGLHKEVEVALCTTGIGLDWGGWGYDSLPHEPNRRSRGCVSAPRNEEALRARVLLGRGNAPRDDLRQLRTRFR